MSTVNYSDELRILIDQYSDAHLTRIEYLSKRQVLLDNIDLEFNGENSAPIVNSERQEDDITAVPPSSPNMK